MNRQVVDGWAHCGIRRFRPMDDLLHFLDHVGIERAVVVQPLGDVDNDYLMEVAAGNRDRFRAVGVVAANASDRASHLNRLAEAGCAGVRMTAADLVRDPSFATEASAAGLTIALHAPDGLASVVPLAGVIGGLDRPVVIAHLGMPTVVDGALDRGAAILALGTVPNVHVLLSGMAMACPYPYEPLRGLVRDVLTSFGPDRVLWGSNFPLADADETNRDLELIRSGAFGPMTEEVGIVTGEAARRLWFESPAR